MTHRARPRHAAPTLGQKLTGAIGARLTDQLARRPAQLDRTSTSTGLRPARPRWRTVLSGAVTGGLALCLLPAMAASAADPHDPFGHLDRAGAVGQNGIHVLGWAADPDQLSQPLTITVSVDGAVAGQVLSAVARPDATAARGAGPKAGFDGTVAAVPGPHLVCASAGNVGIGANGSLGCASVLVPGLTPAQVAAHSPIGMLDHASVAGNTVTLTGWASDPDSLSQPLTITAAVDHHAAVLTKAVPQPRPDVAAAHHTGPNQGYLLTTTIAANGLHLVCTTAANVSVGLNHDLGCAVIRIGPVPLTPAQIAAHSPSGAVESAVAESATGLRVNGWASDPDNRLHSLLVVGYLDGNSARTVAANLSRPDLVASKQAGLAAGFSFAVPASSGAHNICVWAVNIGIGNNSFLGCKALSTPAIAMPSGPTPATPAANVKITALAAKYLGSKYVWGGADPKIGFDCSGLVQYTYRTGAGINTPRVAQDQFSAARMIKQGRAVPGDLVSFHDNLGSVYHVGIYAGAGRMYAAVDPAEGVRYQQIWDPTATFGSFTHG
ncbi:MAG: C40 family peptidase [Jatrophihabitantaceae bacterium]